jgi:uncharacterized DUF497 family protein
MEFEWDPAKDAANLAKHGIGFDDAVIVFADPLHVVEDSTKPEHGERRSKAIGVAAGEVIAVIFTERSDKRRIISARKARRDERARYGRGTSAG